MNSLSHKSHYFGEHRLHFLLAMSCLDSKLYNLTVKDLRILSDVSIKFLIGYSITLVFFC